MPAHCEEALSRVLHSCRRFEHGLLPLEDPGSLVWQKVGFCCQHGSAALVQLHRCFAAMALPGRAALARDKSRSAVWHSLHSKSNPAVCKRLPLPFQSRRPSANE